MTLAEAIAELDAATCLVDEARYRDERCRKEAYEAGLSLGSALLRQSRAIEEVRKARAGG